MRAKTIEIKGKRIKGGWWERTARYKAKGIGGDDTVRVCMPSLQKYFSMPRNLGAEITFAVSNRPPTGDDYQTLRKAPRRGRHSDNVWRIYDELLASPTASLMPLACALITDAFPKTRTLYVWAYSEK